jgi:hypothetical protein
LRAYRFCKIVGEVSARARVPHQVPDIEHDGQHQQHVNQHAGYVKHQETASPENEQQQRDFQERFEFHFLPPEGASWH